MRTVTESVVIGDEWLAIFVRTSDGLEFQFDVSPEDTNGNGEVDVKEFETALTQARRAAYERRVWINKRKALTLDELQQLLTVENVTYTFIEPEVLGATPLEAVVEEAL